MVAPRLQKPVPGPNTWPMASAVLPALAVSVDVGQAVGDGDADLGAGVVHVLLRLQHVRPLLDHLGGQADRHVAGQGEAGQLEFLLRRLRGILPRQHRQLVVQLRLLLDQRGQGGDGLRQLRFLRGKIDAAGIALGELVLEDLHHLGVGVDQLVRGGDLRLDRAGLDGGDRRHC